MGEQAKQSTEGVGTVKGPWDEFKQSTTWQELVDELGDVLQRLELYCRVNQCTQRLDPVMGNLMEQVIDLYGRVKACSGSPNRPTPIMTEQVLGLTRKVRQALPL